MATAISPAQQITGDGQQLVFTCPSSQLVNPVGAVIFNKSSYELEVMNTLVPAWAIWPLDTAALLGGAPTLTMTAILAPGATAQSSTVYVEWFDSATPLPDSQAFIADAIEVAVSAAVLSGTVLLTSGQSAGGANLTIPGIAIPAGITSLGVFITFTGGAASSSTDTLGVSGSQSNETYISRGGAGGVPMWPPSLPSSGLFLGDIVPNVDTSAFLTYANHGPATGTYHVYVIGYVNPPEPHNTPGNPLFVSLMDPTTLAVLGAVGAPIWAENPGNNTLADGVNSGFTDTATPAAIVGAAGAGTTRRIKKMELYTFGASSGPVLCQIVGATSGINYHALSLDSGQNGESSSSAQFNCQEGFNVKMSTANGLTVVATVISNMIGSGQ